MHLPDYLLQYDKINEIIFSLIEESYMNTLSTTSTITTRGLMAQRVQEIALSDTAQRVQFIGTIAVSYTHLTLPTTPYV